MRIQLQSGQLPEPADPPSLLAIAEAFLGDHLGAHYYGPGLRFVVLDFRAKLPKNRPPRTTWRYRGTFAEHLLVEVVGLDVQSLPRSAASLRHLLDRTLPSVLDTRDFWQGDFRADTFERDFAVCRAQLPENDDEFRQLVARFQDIRERAKLRVLAGDEQHRRHTHRPCHTPLAGLRCYAHGRLKSRLEPVLSIQWRLVEGLLRNGNFTCPVYREIYINFAETLEEARRNRTAIEDWHENAYAVVRWDEYESGTPEQRAEMILNAIEAALIELAQIDHLDAAQIRHAIQQVRQTGTNTDIKYRSASNKQYDADIFYRVAEDGGDPYFRLVVVNRATNRAATIDLGRRDLWWLPYQFGRVVLRARDVTIQGRNSERARISRSVDNLPDKLVFPYQDLFPDEAS